MKIVVAVRCLNEINNISRFMRGYDFADAIIVSDGGSTDGSLEMLWDYHKKTEGKVQPFEFKEGETVNGYFWNRDAPHMNYVLDLAKSLNPDWLIFDDMDDVPNSVLRVNARWILRNCEAPQVNAFRLYMWGNDYYFPFMNRNFDKNYKSLWAWKPSKVNIRANSEVHHGTLIGLSEFVHGLNTPYCLLHKSWHPDTIDAKVERQNAVGIQMGHPFTFAGEPKPLPDWAREE